MSSFEIFRDHKNKEYTENDISEHYKKMSIRCAALKWISLTILIAFVIISVSKRGDDLSLDNVRYIIRYFNDKPASLVNTGDGVNYDYGAENQAYIIGDDFAIVGKDGITIYDYSGDILFKDSYSYDRPMATTYGTELFVYNVGGKEVRIYNSYTLLQRLTFESPVFKISVSDNGNYLIQTASGGYRSGVQVYDNDKELIFRHNFGELALQTSDISKSGHYIACASFSSLSDNISTSISVFNTSQVEPVGEITITGEYALSIEFIGNDNIALFTNKGIKIYNINLENIFSSSYEGRSPQKFKISDEYIMISFGLSLLEQSGEIDVISHDGEQIHTLNIPYSAMDFELVNGKAYILSGNTIDIYSLGDKKLESTYETEEYYNRLLKIEQNKFMISSSDRAEIFIYNN